MALDGHVLRPVLVSLSLCLVAACSGPPAGGTGGGGASAGGAGSTAGGDTAGGASGTAGGTGGTAGGTGGTAGGTGGTAGGTGGTAGGTGGTAGGAQLPSTVALTLTPASGVTGTQRVNFGLPVPDGVAAATPVAVRIAGSVVATYARVLATYPSGNARSFQVQFDAPAGTTTAEVALGITAPALPATAVDALLQDEALATNTVRTPRVWVTLPAAWLVASAVAGHLVTSASLTAAPLDAWKTKCNYTTYGTAAFAAGVGTAGSWLYDRGTALYRGYASTGALGPLQAAWRETDLYRQRLLASSTVPPSSDLKYVYTQNLALHYLLSGDDRFREAAETLANRSPVSGYTGAISTGFWTERHAGFGLLANVWAARVSDDQAATFRARANTIVTNLIAIQDAALNLASAPANKMLGATHRCFAHTPVAHDASEYVNLDSATPATLVCSPWMSAIAADGLEAYADDADATRRSAALNAIVRLGRRLVSADDRAPATGRPHYLLGLDGANAPDDFDEHWGEVAYVGAMAWHYSGRSDAALRADVQHYVDGFSTDGDIGQLRSFNWQCRSGLATPYYLR